MKWNQFSHGNFGKLFEFGMRTIYGKDLDEQFMKFSCQSSNRSCSERSRIWVIETNKFSIYQRIVWGLDQQYSIAKKKWLRDSFGTNACQQPKQITYSKYRRMDSFILQKKSQDWLSQHFIWRKDVYPPNISSTSSHQKYQLLQMNVHGCNFYQLLLRVFRYQHLDFWGGDSRNDHC